MTSSQTYTHDYRERFNKKTEKQHYDEVKSLPIRMKDRRVLYGDVQAIYDFEREIQMQGKRSKTIPFFRIRLLWNTFMYHMKTYTMWEASLREIEIQRGTLTANMFYFIKHTLFFNLTLTSIVLAGIIIPHFIIFGWRIDPNTVCPSGFNQSDSAWQNMSQGDLAECCFQHHMTESDSPIKNKKIEWLIRVSKFLGGTSSWLSIPLFYGYYTTHVNSPSTTQDLKAWFPLFYAGSVITVLVISFCILIRNIADGIKEIVRNKDGDVCVFSELVFCGYHHRTLNDKEARFRRKLWLHNVRVAIRAAKAWSRRQIITRKIIVIRIIVFISMAMVIAITGFLIYMWSNFIYDTAETMNDSEKPSIILLRTAVTCLPAIVVSICNTVLPNVFIKISKLEMYTVETSTTLVLYRSLVVRLVSVVLAVSRVFYKSYVCYRVKKHTCTICEKEDKKGHDMRQPCWESVLAREFYKILLVELLMKSFLTVVVDPFRRMLKKIFFRFQIMRRIGTLRFNVIRHSIDIINVQVLCWIGFYFAPTFPLVVCLYLFVIFYVKKFAVLVNCIGAPEAHRVTRTTTIFLSGKLVSFLMVLTFLVVVLGGLQPSRGCGPFASYDVPWQTIDDFILIKDPDSVMFIVFEHVASPSVYVPLIFISLTILYHFYARKGSLSTTAEGVKELITMEGEDKQYLSSRLMQLRFVNQKVNYYDPQSIFDSEKRYVSSTNQRLDLVGQWKDMRAAILPFGMTKAGVQRGELSRKMKIFAPQFRAKSNTSSQKLRQSKQRLQSRLGSIVRRNVSIIELNTQLPQSTNVPVKTTSTKSKTTTLIQLVLEQESKKSGLKLDPNGSPDGPKSQSQAARANKSGGTVSNSQAYLTAGKKPGAQIPQKARSYAGSESNKKTFSDPKTKTNVMPGKTNSQSNKRIIKDPKIITAAVPKKK
ncbi:unnamed protein product [Allacma fusca]|uniref:TMC domain-containing protein n=1 Tax=Allacma fusca TaxID=39272 RepID=A0A8J2LJ58_9HEXA|nr:unnamed protein product [Allacma fusca]